MLEAPEEVLLMRRRTIALAMLAGGLACSWGAIAHDAVQLAQGGWYGSSRHYRSDTRGGWATGTFYGRNGANGAEETVIIAPDGTAEVRTRGEAPKHGTFAGETLTIGSRISKVQPARGGIVIDGAYYRR
jgi:hypothetical protein